MDQKAMAQCNVTTESKIINEIKMTIQNFSKLPIDTFVTGPDFYLIHGCMCLISFKKSEGNLFVYFCNKSDMEIKIQRSLVLYDCNNIKHHEENGIKIFSLEKDINVDVIGSVRNRKGFETLPNDMLVIKLCVDIVGTASLKKKDYLFMSDADPEIKLKEDLKAMLENPINSDVSLQVGDEKIHVHWAVLCSRSPYFKKMYETEMLEREQNSISITDISVTTLKYLIKFLYSAYFFDNKKCDDIEELFDLYYAADKYEVMDLRTLCARKIMNMALADNVVQILQFAHRHSDKDLKMQAMGFIKFNSELVFQTESWKKFEADEPLAAEAFVFCFKKS